MTLEGKPGWIDVLLLLSVRIMHIFAVVPCVTRERAKSWWNVSKPSQGKVPLTGPSCILDDAAG